VAFPVEAVRLVDLVAARPEDLAAHPVAVDLAVVDLVGADREAEDLEDNGPNDNGIARGALKPNEEVQIP
jgi:hypothetical protein